MTINSLKLTARMQAVEVGANDFGGPVFAPDMEQVLEFTAGTGARQADILWMDERTLASNTNLDLDLNAVLTDAFGSTISALELVALFVINAPRSGSANTTNLTIGGGSNPVTGYMGGTTPTIGPIRPGSFVFLGASDAAGFGAIVAGTADILRINNSTGASAVFQIAIAARSA